jgi:hypothetical protein
MRLPGGAVTSDSILAWLHFFAIHPSQKVLPIGVRGNAGELAGLSATSAAADARIPVAFDGENDQLSYYADSVRQETCIQNRNFLRTIAPALIRLPFSIMHDSVFLSR